MFEKICASISILLVIWGVWILVEMIVRKLDR
jgi:hypothetical protein